jgi:hypothetical protein
VPTYNGRDVPERSCAKDVVISVIASTTEDAHTQVLSAEIRALRLFLLRSEQKEFPDERRSLTFLHAV